MRRTLAVLGFLCAGIVVEAHESAAQSVNPVLLWNRTLLVIVRTPGAQPATVHPTRSFAIMHAAVYDAVNAIDKGTQPLRDRADRGFTIGVAGCRRGHGRARSPSHVLSAVPGDARRGASAVAGNHP